MTARRDTTSSLESDRRVRVSLSRLAEPGDKDVLAVVAAAGVHEALRLIETQSGRFARFSARLAALDVDRDLEVAERVGGRVLVPGDGEWPERLDDLPAPPWCLWVRGPHRLDEAVHRSVAVVGSRAATGYGELVAADLAAGVSQRGWTVVSGAAFGIDAAAHRGALAADGTTVAVLAGGFERAYPAAHASLIGRIARDGLVLSEVPPGSAPMKSRFLSRNRLIAALTRGTVVVEADLRSGSRNTVRHAFDLGRPVGVVPGPVTSMMSAGCHEEIRSGRATLVTSAAEVIDLVGDLGVDACPEPRAEPLPVDGLAPAEAGVLEAVPVRAGADLDTLVRLTNRTPLAVRGALGRLEAEGHVVQVEGRWRKQPARRR